MDIEAALSEQMNYERNQQHATIDVNKLLNESVLEKIKNLNPLSDKCCIYRVPKMLRALNQTAYTPRSVSIGPYHRGTEELQEMEDHKRRYLKEFLEWSAVSIDVFIEHIDKNRTRLLNCYAEPVGLSDKDFMEMILVDAAFIIVVVLKNISGKLRSENDCIFGKPGLINQVCLDMCLLENQLPLFIMDDILRLSNIISRQQELGEPPEFMNSPEMRHLTFRFFQRKWPSWLTSESEENLIKSSKVEHFTDFLRICQRPPEQDDPRKNIKKTDIPSVTELQQAGVKFMVGSSENLLAIKFSKDKGILEIPKLFIDEHTEIFIRNVQAFEQCHCSDNYVCDFMWLLSYLVVNPKDVKILVQNGILDNWLPSDEAASVLFGNLKTETGIKAHNFRFAGVIEDLKAYCRKTWPSLKVTLKQNYFNNPWVSISVIAAALLFLLTVTQTVFSILQVVL